MNIEKLTEDDLPALAVLYKCFWGEVSSVEKMRAAFATLKDNPDYIFLVARIDGRVVGAVMGIICYELYGECRPFMVVEDVVVDEQFRRRGIGAALMHSIESVASDRGCSHIILVTDTDRHDARKFYEAGGYDPDKNKGFKKKL